MDIRCAMAFWSRSSRVLTWVLETRESDFAVNYRKSKCGHLSEISLGLYTASEYFRLALKNTVSYRSANDKRWVTTALHRTPISFAFRRDDCSAARNSRNSDCARLSGSPHAILLLPSLRTLRYGFFAWYRCTLETRSSEYLKLYFFSAIEFIYGVSRDRRSAINNNFIWPRDARWSR